MMKKGKKMKVKIGTFCMQKTPDHWGGASYYMLTVPDVYQSHTNSKAYTCVYMSENYCCKDNPYPIVGVTDGAVVQVKLEGER